MADTTDVLLNLIDKQWSQAKQSEDQRSTLTNYVILVAGGLESFIVQRSFSKETLVLAVILVLLGILGAIASAKYYERFRLSMHRVGAMMDKLEELHKDARIWELQTQADKEHIERFPKLNKIRLHYIWLMLHIGIAVLGVINVLIGEHYVFFTDGFEVFF